MRREKKCDDAFAATQNIEALGVILTRFLKTNCKDKLMVLLFDSMTI